MKNLITILGIGLAYIWAWANGWKYVLIGAIILSVIFTSCKTNGYGCKGNVSYKGMVKRINKPY